MSQTPQQKKSRFQVSREVQEDFVNGIAQTMLSLSENAENAEQGYIQPFAGEMPFCPVTGKEYSGANMVRLMLTGMEKATPTTAGLPSGSFRQSGMNIPI